MHVVSKPDANRRSFLRALSGFVATAAVAGRSRPLPAANVPKGFEGFDGVELAIATICTDGFANQHHLPAFEQIPAMGFSNVEFNLWYADTMTPAYIQGLARRCAARGLQPISLQSTGFGGKGKAGIIKDVSHKLLMMQYVRQLGGHIIKFTGSKRGTDGGLQSIIEVCREIAPAAEELGVLVALENHAGNNLETIQDYEEIFAQVDSPNIGLCLDTGHFEGVGIHLHDVLEKLANRTLHVDLKDCRVRGKGHDTVVFGQGVTDFDAFLSELSGTGYRGYLVVEQAWREPQGDWKNDLKSAYNRFKRYETKTR